MSGKISTFTDAGKEVCCTSLVTKCAAQTYILIAGAWHNGWFWTGVKEILESEGHKVMAVDLPGHGNDTACLDDQNLESYSRSIANIMEQQLGQVILVGHSMAGAVVCQASEYKPEKVKKW